MINRHCNVTSTDLQFCLIRVMSMESIKILHYQLFSTITRVEQYWRAVRDPPCSVYWVFTMRPTEKHDIKMLTLVIWRLFAQNNKYKHSTITSKHLENKKIQKRIYCCYCKAFLLSPQNSETMFTKRKYFLCY